MSATTASPIAILSEAPIGPRPSMQMLEPAPPAPHRERQDVSPTAALAAEAPVWRRRRAAADPRQLGREVRAEQLSKHGE
eukprot:701905-Pyramimonas_sp.AAC.1